jgi:hypothetical protein
MQDYELNEDVLLMAEAKIYIERLASLRRSIEYQNIVDAINLYLHTNCEHNHIVEDYIDIDPDNSQRIEYCNDCGLTLQ